MDGKSFLNALSSAEVLLKRGLGAKAHQEILSLYKDFVNNRFFLPKRVLFQTHVYARFAELLRRVGLIQESLEFLHPFVRGTSKSPAQSTDAEKAEYAVSLINFGFAEEGLFILQKNVENYHFKSLYLGFGFINQWNYQRAIPYLKEYLNQKNEDTYFNLVANVNLFSALVIVGDYTESEKIYNQCTKQAIEQKADFLLASIYEIYAQNLFYQKKYPEALLHLDYAKNLIGLKGSRQEYYIQKWTLASKLALGHIKEKEFLDFQNKMLEKKEYETYRDGDFIRALIKTVENNSILIQKLYFGTPYLGYRSRIERFFPQHSFDSYETDLQGLPPIHTKKAISLNEIKNPNNSIKLLKILNSDFYKPFTYLRIHSSLFPGEYFSPFSGKGRVRQAIYRARAELKKYGLRIIYKKGIYELQAEPNQKILIKIEN